MARSVRYLFSSALCLCILAGSTPAFADGAAPTYKAPTYQVVRFNEDWSVLKHADASDDFFDPIKYIPLNEAGDIYLSFGGQVRLRLEAWDGFNFNANGAGTATFAPDDDVFLLTRLLLHADLHLTRHFRVFVQGKSALSTDRDLLGGRRGLDEDDLDLQNAFLDFMFPITGSEASVTLRVGRQELLFGKQRLVSPLDWANTRRTFDGLAAIIKAGEWTLTPFYTMPVAVEKYDFNDVADDQVFAGIYATGKVPGVPAIGLDLYWLLLDKDPTTFNGAANVPTRTNGTTGAEVRHTVGGRIWGKIEGTGLDYDLEGAYQFGSFGAFDISAFMVAAQVGYTLADVPTAPRFHIGFDYASGDHSAGGNVETFNQLFPLGHAYFGWIDQIGRQNVIDLSLGVTFKPTKEITIDLQGHMFWRAETTDAGYNAGGAPFRPAGTGLSSEIGAEIDLLIRYQFDKHTEFQLGYSHFFAGSYIKQTGPAKDIDFLYVAVQYTF
ncbi:MAG: alginate export family protein [Phycisphaeraceae bacterium]